MMNQIDLWHETHFNKKKQAWVDNRSKEIHDQMIELQSKSQEEGAAPMNDREVCVTVLKEKFGYVHGLGLGPKPKSSAFRKTSSVELEEALRRRNEAESQARMLREEMEILKANQAEIYANQEKMAASNEQTQSLVHLLMEELCSRSITQYSSDGMSA